MRPIPTLVLWIVLAITVVSTEPNFVAAPSAALQTTARETAPIDLTGYWVSVVSEDWRHRMATPRPGDYESVPLNGNGRNVADQWSLEADNASGLECKAFGVGGIIRQPGRIHITWDDEETLRMEFDAGTQTRILHFDPFVPAPDQPSWQGHSIAEWETPPGGRGGNARAQIGNSTGPIAPGGGGRGQRGGPASFASLDEGGTLVVRTTGFREGYLRKNGVPYSENASITEYFHRLPTIESQGQWLHVVTVIEDPEYLTQPFYTSTQFKLEPDASGWNPSPCRTAPPPR